MKAIRWILSFVLVMSILCGCSSQVNAVQTPYLTQKERAEIENGILNSLELLTDETYVIATFYNDSDYALMDVNFVADETQTVLFSVPHLEKNTHGKLRVYSQVFQGTDSNTHIYMEYTIGEYSYRSDLKVPFRKSEAPDLPPPVSITITTKDGIAELDYSNAQEFFSGTEIAGLKQFRIYSIIPESPYEDSVYIHLTGSAPDRYGPTLISKLWDEDGIVLHSDYISFYENKQTLYFYDIKPGNYTLTFEETT